MDGVTRTLNGRPGRLPAPQGAPRSWPPAWNGGQDSLGRGVSRHSTSDNPTEVTPEPGDWVAS